MDTCISVRFCTCARACLHAYVLVCKCIGACVCASICEYAPRDNGADRHINTPELFTCCDVGQRFSVTLNLGAAHTR